MNVSFNAEPDFPSSSSDTKLVELNKIKNGPTQETQQERSSLEDILQHSTGIHVKYRKFPFIYCLMT